MGKRKFEKIVEERNNEYGSFQENCNLTRVIRKLIYFDFKYIFDGENYIMPIKLFKDWENSQQEFTIKNAVFLGSTMMALKAVRSIKAKKNLEDSIIDFVNYYNLTQEVFNDNKLGHMVISFDECIFNPVLNDLYTGINQDISQIKYLVDETRVKEEYKKILERNPNE